MAQIYLINVGANTGHAGEARTPISRDGAWVFVPFPNKNRHKGQDFPETARPCVRPGIIKCHLDPDWDRLTYGDRCVNRRARSLLNVQEGDNYAGNRKTFEARQQFLRG
jgi:hypothetical protein